MSTREFDRAIPQGLHVVKLGHPALPRRSVELSWDEDVRLDLEKFVRDMRHTLHREGGSG